MRKLAEKDTIATYRGDRVRVISVCNGIAKIKTKGEVKTCLQRDLYDVRDLIKISKV